MTNKTFSLLFYARMYIRILRGGNVMKLTVLIDNNTLTGSQYYGEPGLSYYIEDNDTKILFDTGYSDIFLHNSLKMNISLNDLDYLVISHGHDDHNRGLKYLIEYFQKTKVNKKPTYISHPLVFTPRVLDSKNINYVVEKSLLEQSLSIKLSSTPIWLNKNIVYLGEIRRRHSFENNHPIGKKIIDKDESDDFLYDDSALVYKSNKGLVIITGCSHSGICNIIDQAIEVCDDNRILDIIGGFHLLNPSEEQISKTVEYIASIRPKALHACHCTDLSSKIKLSSSAPLKEVGVGLKLEYI